MAYLGDATLLTLPLERGSLAMLCNRSIVYDHIKTLPPRFYLQECAFPLHCQIKIEQVQNRKGSRPVSAYKYCILNRPSGSTLSEILHFHFLEFEAGAQISLSWTSTWSLKRHSTVDSLLTYRCLLLLTIQVSSLLLLPLVS